MFYVANPYNKCVHKLWETAPDSLRDRWRALQDQCRARPCQNGFFSTFTVYCYVNYYIEVCYELEILTSNMDFAVILMYLNDLSAMYLSTMFYLPHLENFTMAGKMTTEFCFESENILSCIISITLVLTSY